MKVSEKYQKEIDEAFKKNFKKNSIRLLTRLFKDFLDDSVYSMYYKTQAQALRLIERTGVSFDVPEPRCLDIYSKVVRTDGICITILEPHHSNLCVAEPMVGGEYRVRKLTEREHFRLMGFHDGEIIMGGMTYAQLCSRAGNGWDVNVVGKLLTQVLTNKGAAV